MVFWKEHSPFFTPDEIYSPDTIKYPYLVDIQALIKLNLLRSEVDFKLWVNRGKNKRRGVRSAREQMALVKEVGAALFSMHVRGGAFDITPEKGTLQELAEAAKKCGFRFTKIYESSNFVHCDDRQEVILPPKSVSK